MLKLMLIATGGAVGALLRYGVSGAAQKLTAGTFPLGTLCVNVTGCALIGFLGALFAGPHLVREEYRIAVLVGLLGAFTTFSTFGWETFQLVNAGQYWLAGLNLVLSNGAGFVAVVIGFRIGEALFGASYA